jgi:hypothetical protein
MRCLPKRRWLTALGLFLALAGCQPRPQFKVEVTDISKDVDALLASLWLGNPPESPGIFSSGYSQLIAELPPSDFSQLTLPPCAANDPDCAANNRTYSFGVDYPSDQRTTRRAALVGVAGVTSKGCLSNVVTEVIIEPAALAAPDTLSISFLRGEVDQTVCVSSRFVITNLSLQRDVSSSNGAEFSLLIVNGWGFQPDASLTVSDGCMSYQIGQVKADSTKAQIISVTPTQIVASLGSINVYGLSCGAIKKSAFVTSGQKNTEPFLFQ